MRKIFLDSRYWQPDAAVTAECTFTGRSRNTDQQAGEYSLVILPTRRIERDLRENTKMGGFVLDLAVKFRSMYYALSNSCLGPHSFAKTR